MESVPESRPSAAIRGYSRSGKRPVQLLGPSFSTSRRQRTMKNWRIFPIPEGWALFLRHYIKDRRGLSFIDFFADRNPIVIGKTTAMAVKIVVPRFERLKEVRKPVRFSCRSSWLSLFIHVVKAAGFAVSIAPVRTENRQNACGKAGSGDFFRDAQRIYRIVEVQTARTRNCSRSLVRRGRRA